MSGNTNPTLDRIIAQYLDQTQVGSAPDRQGSFFKYDEAFARKYISAWRMQIARACRFRASKMSRSVVEAEKQQISVPNSVADWVEFALTLDGERIAGELGWPMPGQHDWDLGGTAADLANPPDYPWLDDEPALSPVLTMRLALHGRLRYLQARDEFPASRDQEEEIEETLSWLRGHMT